MMQLSKYLQAQGLGSRKECRALIRSGCVAVNGAVQNDENAAVAPDAVHTLCVDGETLAVIPLPHFYIRLHKPADYETSHKPQHYPSVFTLLPERLRHLDVQAVGRLDADTTGIIVLTNDGAFNHRATSPKHKLAKTYRVTLKHAADGDLCTTLLRGVVLHDDNETVQAAAAQLCDTHTLLLTITSGKYHQVKRMIAAVGNRVAALHRTHFGPWTADDLPVGEWRFFTPSASGSLNDLPQPKAGRNNL